MTDTYDPTPTPEDDLSSSLGELTFDGDGDGYAETTMLDTTGDGVADTMVVEDAWTGGLSVAVDLDGDGTLDTMATDLDGDGIIDESYSEAEGSLLDGGVETFDDGTVDTTSEESGPFAPTEDPDAGIVDEGMHGEPQADIEYHQAQPGPVDCLPTSVAMSLSELTGTEVPADDVIALANTEGFMTDSGMAAEGALTLFESYGVDAELSSGTVDGLREALDNGDTIICGIDSTDLYAEGGGPFDPGMETGHAVVITGIDDGPPGVVYINDPGFPDGAGVEIPLELFEDSWEDSDNTMVVASPTVDATESGQGEFMDDGPTPVDEETGAAVDGEAVAAEAVATVEDGADDGAFEHVRRLILLPLTFKIGS